MITKITAKIGDEAKEYPNRAVSVAREPQKLKSYFARTEVSKEKFISEKELM